MTEWVDPTECEICGEAFRPEGHPKAYCGSDERGEFVIQDEAALARVPRSEHYAPGYRPGDNKIGDHLIAHAQCGIDAGLAMA